MQEFTDRLWEMMKGGKPLSPVSVVGPALGFSKSTFIWWAQRDEIPVVRVGCRYLTHPDVIFDFFKKHPREHAAKPQKANKSPSVRKQEITSAQADLLAMGVKP